MQRPILNRVYKLSTKKSQNNNQNIAKIYTFVSKEMVETWSIDVFDVILEFSRLN
jgi:hypothetical protein